MSTGTALINAGVVLATNETFQDGVGKLIGGIFGGGSSGPRTTPEQRELRDELLNITGYTRKQIQNKNFLYVAIVLYLLQKLDNVIVPGDFLRGGLTASNCRALLRQNGASALIDRNNTHEIRQVLLDVIKYEEK